MKNNNNSENKDMLSDLPDCLILHILSFLDTKEAVQTCILSMRWKNIWKHLPNLTLLESSQFNMLESFTTFISNILSLRGSSTSLNNIYFRYIKFIIDPRLLETIVEYAVSHNVKLLDIYLSSHIQSFPPCLFSSPTLTSLHLQVTTPHKILFPISLNLPALTSLVLWRFSFPLSYDGRAEPFSKLKKLKRLFIYKCEVNDAQNLCISSLTLVALLIIACPYCFGIELSTPSLVDFRFSGIPLQKLCGSNSNLPNIKHVYIDLINLENSAQTSLLLLNWLVELANIQSLKVTSNTLKVLQAMFILTCFLILLENFLKNMTFLNDPNSS